MKGIKHSYFPWFCTVKLHVRWQWQVVDEHTAAYIRDIKFPDVVTYKLKIVIVLIESISQLRKPAEQFLFVVA